MIDHDLNPDPFRDPMDEYDPDEAAEAASFDRWAETMGSLDACDPGLRASRVLVELYVAAALDATRRLADRRAAGTVRPLWHAEMQAIEEARLDVWLTVLSLASLRPLACEEVRVQLCQPGDVDPTISRIVDWLAS